MKTKAIIAGCALMFAGSAMAEGYNRAGLTYNLGHYNFNKDMEKATIAAGFDDFTGFCTNGFGINYAHGFSLSNTLPMYLEAGAELNFNFSNKKVDEELGIEYHRLFQDINLNIPINFTWHFGISDNLTIAPYTGISFKIHMMTRQKDRIEGYGEKEESKWISVYDDGDDAMGGKESTWNRFQMAWQIGANAIYKNKYSIGLEYGYDMIPAYSHNFKDIAYQPRVTNGTFKIALGYIF
ncbi:MAG: outer membrane beta-barrel protein [Muribaculaceae bacterium]|nr:outer membrane beta-barrel protein [Muribaculaceae bacterium]